MYFDWILCRALIVFALPLTQMSTHEHGAASREGEVQTK